MRDDVGGAAYDINAAGQIAGYAAYVRSTVKKGGDAEGEELDPLYFDTSKDDPPSTLQMSLQFVVSLAILRHELGGLHWPSIKKRIWLNLPRDPRTGKTLKTRRVRVSVSSRR